LENGPDAREEARGGPGRVVGPARIGRARRGPLGPLLPARARIPLGPRVPGAAPLVASAGAPGARKPVPPRGAVRRRVLAGPGAGGGAGSPFRIARRAAGTAASPAPSPPPRRRGGIARRASVGIASGVCGPRRLRARAVAGVRWAVRLGAVARLLLGAA